MFLVVFSATKYVIVAGEAWAFVQNTSHRRTRNRQNIIHQTICAPVFQPKLSSHYWSRFRIESIELGSKHNHSAAVSVQTFNFYANTNRFQLNRTLSLLFWFDRLWDIAGMYGVTSGKFVFQSNDKIIYIWFCLCFTPSHSLICSYCRSRAVRKHDACLLQRSRWRIYRIWCHTKCNIWCGYQMETRFRLKSAITKRKPNSMHINSEQGNTNLWYVFF